MSAAFDGIYLNWAFSGFPWCQISAAAQVVMQLFVTRMEPLYALSSLRTSVENLLSAKSTSQSGNGGISPALATAFALGLRGIGMCFVQLPSEVRSIRMASHSPLWNIHERPKGLNCIPISPFLAASRSSRRSCPRLVLSFFRYTRSPSYHRWGMALEEKGLC